MYQGNMIEDKGRRRRTISVYKGVEAFVYYVSVTRLVISGATIGNKAKDEMVLMNKLLSIEFSNTYTYIYVFPLPLTFMWYNKPPQPVFINKTFSLK
jgi:hypothetical protein